MPIGGLAGVQRGDRHQCAAVDEVPARVLGDDERAGEADVEHGTELVDGHVDDEPDIAEPGAAHHDVDRAGLREEGGDGVLVDDVDERGGVRRAQLGGPGLRSIEVAVGDDHPVALGCQCPRGRPADAGRAADDDRGGHSVLPSGRGSAHLAAIAPHGSA